MEETPFQPTIIFKINTEEDNARMERVRKMLEETDKRCQATLNSCSNTISTLETSLKTICDTRSCIDQYYADFNDTMDGLYINIAAAFGESSVFKKGESKPAFKQSHESNVKECFELIKDKKRIVFLTGAGISLASGIPTFKGSEATPHFKKDGITYMHEEIASAQFMHLQPELFWERNLEYVYAMQDKTYNISHVKIQELMNVLAPSFTLVTQNIDGLHSTAFDQLANATTKSEKSHIYEIHGNKDLLRCKNFTCDEYDIPFKMPKERVKNYKELICPECKTLARPHILYFDESYTESNSRAISLTEELKDMDALVCVGITLDQSFASGMISKALIRSIPIIEINPIPSCEFGAHFIKDKAELVLPELCDALIKYQSTKKINKNQKLVTQAVTTISGKTKDEQQKNSNGTLKENLLGVRKNSVVEIGRKPSMISINSMNKIPTATQLKSTSTGNSLISQKRMSVVTSKPLNITKK